VSHASSPPCSRYIPTSRTRRDEYKYHGTQGVCITIYTTNSMTHQNITNQMRRIGESCYTSRTQWVEFICHGTQGVCVSLYVSRTRWLMWITIYITNSMRSKIASWKCVCVCVFVFAWRKGFTNPKDWLQGSYKALFLQKSTNNKALLWKMTYKDKATLYVFPGEEYMWVRWLVATSRTKWEEYMWVRWLVATSRTKWEEYMCLSLSGAINMSLPP